MRTITILAFGAFGGMCPTIARLASHYSRNPGSDMPETGAYMAMALFAILGAFIAVGFGAKEVKAAIVSGIAAPGLVTNIVAGAATAGAASAVAVPASNLNGFAFFATPAYAEQHVASPGTQHSSRSLTLNPSFQGAAPTDAAVSYSFLDAQGVRLPGGGVLIPDETGVAVAVPADAVSLEIGDHSMPLPDSAQSASVTIMTAPTLGGDLVWALGGERRFKLTDVDVTYGQ